MKKGPLTKVEKFYIDSHLDCDVVSVAKDLERTKKSVQSYIKKASQNKKESEIKESGRKAGDLMAKHDSRGATTMTQAASELSDDNRKKSKPQLGQRYHDSVCRIKK